MGKQTQQKPAPVKRGTVINRSANHTRDQDHAHSPPKWADVGEGVLSNGKGNLIRRNKDTNQWESVKEDNYMPPVFAPVDAHPLTAQDIGG